MTPHPTRAAALARLAQFLPAAGRRYAETREQGYREQALKIWREGLLLAADNETLLGTLKRLQVKP